MEEEVFSLGGLDDTPDYVEQTEDNEQEELHPEDVSEIYEEQDSEEYSEDEEFDEEESEEVEDDSISYTPFVEDLIEDGVLYVDEDKEYDDTPEGFQEIIEDTINHRLGEVVSQLPEVLQQVLELAQLGEDPYTAFQNLNPFDYSQVDLEDESTRRSLVEDYYRENLGWSDEKIAKRIQTLEDLDELGEEAQEAQNFFIQKTEAEVEAYQESVRQANEEAYYRQQQEVEQYNRLIDESRGFKGLEFTSNQDKESFRAYCFDKGRDGLTQYERDTMNAEDKMAQAFYTYKKFGFESIEKKARSSAYVEQKKVLARYKDRNASSNASKGIEVERPSKGFKLGKI